jgi:hypothetical protein
MQLRGGRNGERMLKLKLELELRLMLKGRLKLRLIVQQQCGKMVGVKSLFQKSRTDTQSWELKVARGDAKGAAETETADQLMKVGKDRTKSRAEYQGEELKWNLREMVNVVRKEKELELEMELGMELDNREKIGEMRNQIQGVDQCQN